MRTAISVVGVLSCLCGGVFFLQGIGVLGGSFMSHSATWAVIGGALVVLGAALLVGTRKAGGPG